MEIKINVVFTAKYVETLTFGNNRWFFATCLSWKKIPFLYTI